MTTNHVYMELNYLRTGVVMLEQIWESLVSVKGNLITKAYRDILLNCVLPTLGQKFGEEPYLGVMVRGAHTFDPIAHNEV